MSWPLASTANKALYASSAEATTRRDPLEEFLHAQIDQIRELLSAGSAQTALKQFEKLLATLPATASNHAIFRVKANIGHCHTRLGDDQKGAQWLLEALAADPTDPKAIANKVLAHLLLNENEEAVRFARATLASDPGNELVAFYLVQAVARLPGESDPFTGVPPALTNRADVVFSEIVFHRMRGDPVWTNKAQEAHSRYPDNKRIALLSAEADIVEIGQQGDYRESYKLPAAVRSRLENAAELLSLEWDVAFASEQKLSDEHFGPASSAMVAWKLLRQQQKAFSIARQLVEAKVHDRQALANAAQILNDEGNDELVEQALALAPDAPELEFMKALRLLDAGNWEASAHIFERIQVPDFERDIVRAIVALVPFRDPSKPVTEADLRKVMPEAASDPRALIVFARVARHRGLLELSEEAFAHARAGIGSSSNMAARLMVASYAADANDAAAVIELLQDHIPLDQPSTELRWLATAHGIQRPKRPGNAEFFNKLPASVLALPAYARSHASVLLDMESAAEAVPILKTLRENSPRVNRPAPDTSIGAEK